MLISAIHQQESATSIHFPPPLSAEPPSHLPTHPTPLKSGALRLIISHDLGVGSPDSSAVLTWVPSWGSPQSPDGSCRAHDCSGCRKGTNRNYKTFYDQVSGAHTAWLLSPFTGQGKSFILQNYTWNVDSRVWRNRLCLSMRSGDTLQRCRHRKCEFFSGFQCNSFLLWAKLMSKLSLYLSCFIYSTIV